MCRRKVQLAFDVDVDAAVQLHRRQFGTEPASAADVEGPACCGAVDPSPLVG
jgi:hypothetical protein